MFEHQLLSGESTDPGSWTLRFKNYTQRHPKNIGRYWRAASNLLQS